MKIEGGKLTTPQKKLPAKSPALLGLNLVEKHVFLNQKWELFQRMTIISDNAISRIWTFLFPNLAKWGEINVDRPKFLTNSLILFTNSHSDHPLLNPYFECYLCGFFHLNSSYFFLIILTFHLSIKIRYNNSVTFSTPEWIKEQIFKSRLLSVYEFSETSSCI